MGMGKNVKICCVLLLLAAFLFFSCNGNKGQLFVIGIPDEWGDISPSLQNSVYTDVITSNQFETLVRMDRNGMIEPLAATSWSVSPNFDEIRFKIDTTRRFSNGKFLTAQDFKNAWEQGLALSSGTFNGAFKDILSRVQGYEKFKKTKMLSGLVVDGDSFILKFVGPFRSALSFIFNTRLGVFMREGSEFIGTGPYRVTYNDGKMLEMTPNKYFKVSPVFSKIRLKVINPKDAEGKLNSGEVQAYLFAEKAIVKACASKQSKIKCISGREGRHEYVTINGLPGSFFHEPKYRKAIQSLLLLEVKKSGLPDFMKFNNVRQDPQVYLDFQLGRLSDQEADKIIHEGDIYVSKFIKATKSKPLYLLAYDEPNWVQNILQKKGVTFTKNSGVVSKNFVLGMYSRKKNVSDMIVGGASLANGDPDGLYHGLGLKGSHTSPMAVRPSISKLLEGGRSIIDRKAVNEHYKNVSRAVLREVPFVHIGFSLGVIAYRADLVSVNAAVKNRDAYGLNIFVPK